MIDKKLLEFCVSDTQRRVIQAVIEHGSNTKAAKALGVQRRGVDKIVNRVKGYAARKGYSPDHDMTKTVPDGFMVKGVSTYYDDEGKPRGQWVKSSADIERMTAIIKATFEGMCEDIPRAKPVKAPDTLPEHLLNCFVLTDYHLGSLSWAPETGEDWDLEIAEDMLYKWIAAAIKAAPKAKTAVFAQLGDFLHFDSLTPKTPESGHILDADTRAGKIVRAAIRAHRRITELLLKTHESVHLIISDANHDPYAQLQTREWMSALYENEPRLTVDDSPSPYNCYHFDNVALFFHHGHKRGVNNISEVFAGKFRDVFGMTKHAYAHLGHLHHKHTKENCLMVVEQHRTLAAADAYAARGGWLSGRDAQVITYHSEHGEVARSTINSDMLK